VLEDTSRNSRPIRPENDPLSDLGPVPPRSNKKWMIGAALLLVVGIPLLIALLHKPAEPPAPQAQTSGGQMDAADQKKAMAATDFQTGKGFYESKQFPAARSSFDSSCQNGEMQACNYLGYMWAKGQGGSSNSERAAQLFMKACNGGVMSSCVSLGTLLQDNDQKAEAQSYFKKACDGGSVEGCKALSSGQ
jgi:hypothetical protein